MKSVMLSCKTCRPVAVFLLCLLFIIPAAGQEIMTAKEDSLFKANSAGCDGGIIPGRYYILFGAVDASVATSIRQIDERLTIVEPKPGHEKKLVATNNRFCIANNNWKLAPGLALKNGKSARPIQTWVITARSLPQLLPVVKNNKQVQLLSTDLPTQSAIIRCSENFLIETVVPHPELVFVSPYIAPSTETSIIGYDRSMHGINQLDYAVAGANGKNIVVGVKEKSMDSRDLDLFKRVRASSLSSAEIDNHATVISSIIGGSGNSFYDGRGMANGCFFFSSSFDNLFADAAGVLGQAGVTIQNHSYGTIPQQFYGPEALSYDKQTWENKNLVHIFSAGNRGTASATDGKYSGIAGYANTTGNFKMAKNVLLVGAVSTKGIVANESSAGPAYDGRLVPQLCALGPNGTSDAAAMVSGTVAVLQQVYADSNAGSQPPASLIKALLFTTADDVHNPGIDFKTGYGLLNSIDALQALRQKNYFTGSTATGQLWTKDIIIPANIAALTLTLCWTDTAASLNNFKALVNDLDLELEDVGTATTYKPWILNTAAAADSLQKAAIRGRDSLNTAEQISLRLPAAGTYRIKVKAQPGIVAPLQFSLAFKTDTLQTFHFTNPQHASDIVRHESDTLTLRWRTYVANDSQTGQLSVSYNNGSNWQLIDAAAKLSANSYRWFIKDTACTVLFRMQTSFGYFLSKQVVSAPVLRPQVDFLCSDSFGLSWNKHFDATGYKIYTLIDSAYLKPLMTITDTAYVFNRQQYPSMVYAVEPVLNSGLPAARSVAFDLSYQGVNCFFRSFYHTLLDDNKVNLSLELSSTYKTDSVYFEEVTAQGQPLVGLGGQRATQDIFLYTQLTPQLSKGLTYFRARIKLKNGQSVYTDIISVQSTGKKSIVFYPNPVKRSTPVMMVLRQGLPLYSRVYFYDITGRQVKSVEAIQGTVDLSGLPAGVYVYKLTDENGNKLEAGKLILTQ